MHLLRAQAAVNGYNHQSESDPIAVVFGTSMLHKSDHCLNCGEPAPGQFCAQCGQKNTHYHVSFGELLEEVVSELFQLDSRIGRTVVPFLFQPGKLTREFVAGRRIRFSSPLRLYLLSSFVYFLVLSLVGPSKLMVVSTPPTETRGPSASEPVWENLSPAERKQFVQRKTAGLSKYGRVGNEVKEKIDELAAWDGEKIAQKLRGGISGKMSKAMFFLLPLFALLLKVLFVGSGRYYIEHLVFALHFHSFCFVALLVPALVSREQVGLIAMIWILVYLLVALRRVYGQSWPRSVAKYVALVASYGMLLGLGMLTMMILTILF